MIQVQNRFFFESPVQILTQDNTAPNDARELDVSTWVPSGALWYWVACPLARALACTSSNYNAPGTVDMAWTCRLTQYPDVDFGKWCQIALHNQVPGSMQEISGDTICIPNIDNVRKFIWRTRSPDQHDYYDSAQLTLWLMGYEMDV